jgi:lipopolysaccharide transport system permease protein
MSESSSAATDRAVPPVTWNYSSRRGSIMGGLREIWQYRDLIALSVRRDFIAVNSQTVMGPLWFFIQPLITTVAFTLVFQGIANLPTDKIPPFLFYMSGIVVWYFFSGCLSKISLTFTSNSSLITKIYFPRLTIPIANTILNLWLSLVQFIIFLGFYAYFYWKGAPLHPSYRVIIIPALIIQTALLGMGVGCLIAALTTRFRDLQMVVSPAIQLWMYGSCIFFPRSMVPQHYQWLMNINPVVPIVESFRFALMGQGDVEIWQWLVSLAITLVLLVIGLWAFKRAEENFADTI